MQRNGQPYVFRVEDIKQVELNKLIDQGRRFILKAGLIEGTDEFDSVEEVLHGKVSTLREN